MWWQELSTIWYDYCKLLRFVCRRFRHFVCDSQAHIYDVESLQCFTPSVSESHHVGGINQVRCAGDGKQFATAGKDGTVKLWDIASSKCIATLDSAHDKMVWIICVLPA